jgi:hypothetical protein
MSTRRLLGAAMGLLLAVAPVMAQWTNVGAGIDYQMYSISGPNKVFVTRMAISNASAFIESSIAQGRLSGGTQIVSNQAAHYDDAIGYWGEEWGTRNDVVVAINGSYFNTSTGEPFPGTFHSGWYAQRHPNATGTSGFAWRLNRNTFIGECISHFAHKQIITYATSNTQQFQGVNRARGDNELIIYTPQYDTNTKTDNTGSEVLVELPRPLLALPTPSMVTGTVRQIRQNLGSTQMPFDHVVLSAKGSAATTLLNNVQVGDTIGISQELHSYQSNCSTTRSLDWTKTYASISSNWVFLRDGVIQYGIDSSGARHPRTAIGLNSTYVFFLVVDGRQSGWSIGMTIDELAEFFKNTLGATWACNQDGGGSSTMWINGTVVNSPSDGSQRAVANGMLMCNILPKAQSTVFTAGGSVTTTGAANVRLGPGTNYAVITSVSSGTAGTVLEHPLKGVYAKGFYWWKVSFPSVTGWVVESLLSGGGSCTAPAITTHPTSQTVATGGTANFSVAASGTTPLSYQWQKNSVNLSNGGHYSGVTTDTLTISNADSNDEANYRCVVSNACGSATSNQASLTVTSGGGGDEFIVESRSGGQNYNRYSEIGGWSNSSSKSTAPGCTAGIGHRYAVIGTIDRRAIFSFTPSAGGTYEVFTTNTNTSNSGDPLMHRVYHAGGNTLVAVCQNSTCTNNAINKWYSLGQYTLNAGLTYTVELDARTAVGSGPSGWAARSDAIRWVSVSTSPEPPTITQHPTNQTVAPGGTANFSVTASGTEPLSYQWQKNNVNLANGGHYSGATTATLTISNADSNDEANYRCVVTNAYGSATSNNASLTISSQPVVYIVESRSGGQNYAQYSEVGSWGNSSAKSTAAGCTSGIGSRYCVIGASDRRAIFRFTPTVSGSYSVYTTNGTTDNSGNPLIHKITHAGGTATVGVCQNTSCGTNAVNKWLLLGTWTLNAGTQYTVTLDGNTASGSSPSGYAGRSDAIKWEKP